MDDCALARLKSDIADLRRNSKHGRIRPHKLVLLLTVLDMVEEGLLEHNRIYFDDDLTTRFEKYFDTYGLSDDLCQPGPPFFHLRSSSFWCHQVKPGKDAVYNRLDTSGGGSKRILDTIDYSYFSEEAFEIIKAEATRKQLRAFIEAILETERG